MSELSDTATDPRAEEIRAALALLRSAQDVDVFELRHACAVVLALSKEPDERMSAEGVLKGLPR